MPLRRRAVSRCVVVKKGTWDLQMWVTRIRSGGTQRWRDCVTQRGREKVEKGAGGIIFALADDYSGAIVAVLTPPFPAYSRFGYGSPSVGLVANPQINSFTAFSEKQQRATGPLPQ